MRSGSLPTSSLPFRVEGSPRGLGGFITAVLLILILAAAPLVLGAARLWYELPLLVALAALFLLQGLRLCGPAIAQARLQLDAIDLAVIFFLIYAVARWLTSPTEYFSRLEALNVFAYAGIFLTGRYGLVRRTYGYWLLGMLVVVVVGETAFGYYLVNHLDWFPFGPTERLHLYYAPRWVGTYGCPNHYAELLIMGAMAALALGSFSKLPWPLRIVLFYLAVVIMMGVFYSISRGAWISLFGALIAVTVFALRHGTVRWWVPVVGALAILLIFAGTVSTSTALQKRLEELRTSAVDFDGYVRYKLARDALHIAHDHPAFGTGPGTFVFVHPRYQDQAFGFKAELTHDDYLNCLSDYGLVGFAIAIFFVFAVTLALWRRLSVEKRWRDRVLVAAGLGAWTSLSIHSLFDFNLHIPANPMILFALTGIALHSSGPEEAPARHWSTLSLAPLGRGCGVVVVLLSIAFGLEAARSAVSDIIYEKALARAENIPSIQAIEETQDALTWDHGNAQALVLLGDIYRVRASRETGMENRVREGTQAMVAYQRALQANPLDDTVEARLALTFDIMHRYPEAYFCYQQALFERPFDGQFWRALGNHFWERGILDKAEAAYHMAARCPLGSEGGTETATEIGRILDAAGLPQPAPDANPLAPPPPEPPTTP